MIINLKNNIRCIIEETIFQFEQENDLSIIIENVLIERKYIDIHLDKIDESFSSLYKSGNYNYNFKVFFKDNKFILQQDSAKCYVLVGNKIIYHKKLYLYIDDELQQTLDDLLLEINNHFTENNLYISYLTDQYNIAIKRTQDIFDKAKLLLEKKKSYYNEFLEEVK